MKRVGTVSYGRRFLTSLIVDDPELLRLVSSPVGYGILSKIAHGSGYPAEIARELNVSKQLAYYYVRQLEEMGLVVKVGEDNVRGGRAQLYQANFDSITLIINKRGWREGKTRNMPRKIAEFLSPVVNDGRMDGIVVVGSPHPHGPNMAVASDGHYAFQLGLFLGQYIEPTGDFKVRLDVDVKAEKLYDNNMILIGGPGVNLITAMVNNLMPIRFNEKNYWASIISPNNVYTSEFTGLVAKVRMENGRYAIVLAGLRSVGTKAAILMLTSRWRELLRGYDGEDEWAAVIMGLDLDGDGRIDSAKLLEHT